MDNGKLVRYQAEMATHANGAVQYAWNVIIGRYFRKGQLGDMLDYNYALAKMNYFLYSNESPEVKDALISRKEYIMSTFKRLMGI